MHEGRSHWFAKHFIIRPCSVLLINLAFFVICIGLTFGMNLLTMDNSVQRSYFKEGDKRTENFDMYSTATTKLKENSDGFNNGL